MTRSLSKTLLEAKEIGVSIRAWLYFSLFWFLIYYAFSIGMNVIRVNPYYGIAKDSFFLFCIVAIVLSIILGVLVIEVDNFFFTEKSTERLRRGLTFGIAVGVTTGTFFF